MWIGSKAAKGYLEADFAEVWPRYLSRADFDALRADLPPEPAEAAEEKAPDS
jgi:hypothetical protein